ncbi:hypothetical protein GSI_11363 [Ganoderma sinense ZZ0214-1]|uniref:Uncharacterized protein n=1 Tax=Ganoderma sinense ZZ0214-1 TaxID=1077348 RepID=A0A2G8RVV5_9APHY|nr:hypothetical protein GSI_11363 [Ganoderma sinense ZZ0214-1]
MGLFYPDNPKRAARVQQLVESTRNLQANIQDIGRQIDKKSAQYRPAIDALLKTHGVASVDDVINDAASKMSPDERKVFGFDTTYFVAGLLMGLKGAAFTASAAISAAQWGMRMVNVMSLANFVTAAEGGEAAAAAAAAEISAEAAEAAEALEGVSEAAEAAGVAAEIAGAATIVGSISVVLDFFAGVGLLVGLAAALVDLFEGAEQKRKLVNAIHQLQPARLTMARFEKEGVHIMDQLLTLSFYLSVSPGGSEADAAMAAKASVSPLPLASLAKKMVSDISDKNSKIDLNQLESDLEAQDRQARNFYGGADLSHDAVIAGTSKD